MQPSIAQLRHSAEVSVLPCMRPGGKKMGRAARSRYLYHGRVFVIENHVRAADAAVRSS